MSSGIPFLYPVVMNIYYIVSSVYNKDLLVQYMRKDMIMNITFYTFIIS